MLRLELQNSHVIERRSKLTFVSCYRLQYYNNNQLWVISIIEVHGVTVLVFTENHGQSMNLLISCYLPLLHKNNKNFNQPTINYHLLINPFNSCHLHFCLPSPLSFAGFMYMYPLAPSLYIFSFFFYVYLLILPSSCSSSSSC